jgi:putative transposase
LLYAALLSLLVSRDLLDLFTEQADDEIVFLLERWAATIRLHAQLILHKIGQCLGYSPPPLLEQLIEDARRFTSNDQSSKKRSLLLHNRCES